MELIYPFLVSFIMVFIAELGDKTQLLVLSFSSNVRVKNIILGIAIGSFFSHGIAIIFGSQLGSLENNNIKFFIELITYSSFVFMGVLNLIPKKIKITNETTKKNHLLSKISNLKIGYTLIIALSILIGEFGDKTFLASMGFGIQYPNFKIMLIMGAIAGMITSDSIAIIFGKFLNKYISEEKMQHLSGVLFLIFGFLGFFSVLFI